MKAQRILRPAPTPRDGSPETPDAKNDKWFEEFETLVDDIGDTAVFLNRAQAFIDETDDWREAMRLQQSVDALHESFVEATGDILDTLASVLWPKLVLGVKWAPPSLTFGARLTWISRTPQPSPTPSSSSAKPSLPRK
jgi:hypothetical protein